MARSIADKTPPHDDEMERAALGSMLTDMEAISTAIQMRLTSEDFYSHANARIYDAIMNLDKKGVRPDIQTVVQELRQMTKLDEAGGASYVSSLTTVIPSSANIEFYIQMVKNYSLKRALLKLASKIGVNAYDESREATEVLEDMQRDINKISDERQIVSARKIGDVLKETIDIISQVMKSKNPTTGVPSGFLGLDEKTAGFQREEFIIIGARPSVGKTALALNIAANIAIHNKIPTAFFSLEMSSHALVQRIISSEANVMGHKLRTGFLSTNDFTGIIDASADIFESPLYIIDMPNGRIEDIRTQARRMRNQQQPVEVIFIDYLGLIVSDNKKQQRFEQISEISRSLKSLARELHIPIIVLCQLNRDAQFEVPTLANLRDSGSIEQDADLVLFLHRPVPKNRKNKDDDAPAPVDFIPTDLIIAKQRNGPIGTINLELVTKYAKFAPLAKERMPSNSA